MMTAMRVMTYKMILIIVRVMRAWWGIGSGCDSASAGSWATYDPAAVGP